MAGFRGIGDAATEVKMKQDQMALQESLSNAARASSESMANASRAESARQFNISANAQQNRLAEDVRRFDSTLAAQQENTAWARSQEEKKLAEDTRRFDVSQQAALRDDQRADRQLSLQEFGARLSEARLGMDAESHDIQTKMGVAQLDQYLAATKEEQMSRTARENMAKGAFGSLVIAGRMNGGVMPLKAIELANQQLGDKDNQIVGGGFDEDTGIAFFNIKNMLDPNAPPKTIRMTPENQYAAIHAGVSKQAADLWMDTFKTASSARLGMERKRMEMDAAMGMFKAKEDYKSTVRGDAASFKKADAYLERAKDIRKQYGIENRDATDDERKRAFALADKYSKAADDILMADMPKEQQEFTLTPELREQYGIPPTGTRTTKNGDVTRVAWPVGKQYHYVDFGPDGKAIPEKQTAAPQPVGPRANADSAQQKTSIPPQDAPTKPAFSADAFSTKLTPEEEQAFAKWKQENAPNDSGYDYDLRGEFKSGAKKDPTKHGPDTFKKPNHPTFSTDSRYSNAETPGGVWGKDAQGRDTYTPSEWMKSDKVRMAELQDYFKRVEPNGVLILDGQAQKQKTTQEQASDFANRLATDGVPQKKISVALTNMFGKEYGGIQGVAQDPFAGEIEGFVKGLKPPVAAEAQQKIDALRRQGVRSENILQALRNFYGQQ